ncbi:hypothetical protein D3C81_2147220 [compost metagenome]
MVRLAAPSVSLTTYDRRSVASVICDTSSACGMVGSIWKLTMALCSSRVSLPTSWYRPRSRVWFSS